MATVQEKKLQILTDDCDGQEPMHTPVQRKTKRAVTLPSPSFLSFLEVDSEQSPEFGPSEDAPATPSMATAISARSRSGKDVICPPGMPVPTDLPSRGSILHASGDCQPCAWFWRPGSCQNGQDCGHCHLCPEGEIKLRKKQKHSLIRMGLATPKSADGQARKKLSEFQPEEHEQKKITGPISIAVDSPKSIQPNLWCPTSPLPSPTGMMAGSWSTGYPSLGVPSPVLAPQAEPSSEPLKVAISISPPLLSPSSTKKGTLLLPVGEMIPTIPSAGPFDLPEADALSPMAPTRSKSEGDVPLLQKPFGTSNSVGSALHGSGLCKPCAWYWRPGSCQNGEECLHCHLCDEGVIKQRKKAKQAALRQSKLSIEVGEDGVDPTATGSNDSATGTNDHTASMVPSLTMPVVASGGNRANVSIITTWHSGEQESTTASCSDEDDGSNCSDPRRSGGKRKAEGKARTRGGALLNLPPGLKAPPGTPSHGSSLHKLGNCWPCTRFWKSGGCPQGDACSYCHLCPAGEMKFRKQSKQTMLRLGLSTPKAQTQVTGAAVTQSPSPFGF